MGDDRVVAAVLTLLAHTSGQPVHDRMEEEDDLDSRLHQIREIVVSADVVQFFVSFWY